MAIQTLLRTVVLITLAISLFQDEIEGFEFTYKLDPSEDGQTPCGVLLCSEKLSNISRTLPASSQEVTSKKIASLTIYKLNTQRLGTGSDPWVKLAAVTSRSPRENKTSDRVIIVGTLSDTEASVSVGMSLPGDCMSTKFYCESILVDGDSGQSIVTKSFIKTKDGSAFVKYDDEDNSSFCAPETVHLNKTGDRLLSVLLNKLNCLQKQMDNFVRDQTLLGNQLQAMEVRVGDKIDRIENRLRYKRAIFPLARYIKPKVTVDCVSALNQVTTKLDGLIAIVETIEKNVTNQYKSELSTAVSVLSESLERLTVDLFALTNLTVNLGNNVDDFKRSYVSGALVPVEEFSDALGTGRKEWRLAFRGTAYNNIKVYQAYLYGTGIPPEIEAGCKQFDHSLPCINHYRNRDALENWTNIHEVLFAVYHKGRMVHKVVFNARGSDYINWFEPSRVIVSSWRDLKTAQHNIFSISGIYYGHHRRRFYICHKFNACQFDLAWFTAFDSTEGCAYETREVAFPYFLYAPGHTKSLIQTNFGRADAFGVFLKYH